MQRVNINYLNVAYAYASVIISLRWHKHHENKKKIFSVNFISDGDNEI